MCLKQIRKKKKKSQLKGGTTLEDRAAAPQAQLLQPRHHLRAHKKANQGHSQDNSQSTVDRRKRSGFLGPLCRITKMTYQRSRTAQLTELR